jgi:putative transcriptional regulator
MDKVTLRKLEVLSLPEVKKLSPTQIRRMREAAKLSRGVWAKILNIGVTTAQKWEKGETHPEGAALKLLNLIQVHGIRVLI